MDKNKEVIVTRLLKNKDSNSDDVEIIIYKPVQESDGFWSCSFVIGSEKDQLFGEDSMQALLISMDSIRNKLENMTDLFWIDGLHFLGFPLFVPMYLPDKERNEIEAILKSEINKFIDTAEATIQKNNL